jgi:hypothetical protein
VGIKNIVVAIYIDLLLVSMMLGGGGSKYYGREILNPTPPYILRVGIQRILVVRH